MGGDRVSSRRKNENNSLHFWSHSDVPGRGSGHLICIIAFNPSNFSYHYHSYFTDEEIKAQESEGQRAKRN